MVLQNWSAVTALFGGTFDPPHLGHQGAAVGLLARPGVREVWILPSGIPHLKTAQQSAAHRLNLCHRAFDGIGGLRVQDLEWRRSESTGQPSYTYDTLISVKAQLPEAAFVIGTDQIQKLPQWHRFPDVLNLSHWMILKRKGLGKEAQTSLEQGLAEWRASGLIGAPTSIAHGLGFEIRGSGKTLLILETDAPAVSSTEIRNQIAKTGTPPESSLSSSVREYLLENRLYGTSRPAS